MFSVQQFHQIAVHQLPSHTYFFNFIKRKLSSAAQADTTKPPAMTRPGRHRSSGQLQLLLLIAALLALLAPAPCTLTVPLPSLALGTFSIPIQGQTWWRDHGNGHGSAIVKPINGPGERLDNMTSRRNSSSRCHDSNCSSSSSSSSSTLGIRCICNVDASTATYFPAKPVPVPLSCLQ
jgi:hypothetical protein